MRTDNGAPVFGYVFGGRLAVVDLPQDARGLRLSNCVPQPRELVGGEKAFAALLAERLNVGGGIVPVQNETAYCRVAVDRADTFHDPVGCHRLGLADPPMHLCDIGWRHSVELHAADPRDGVPAKVDFVVNYRPGL